MTVLGIPFQLVESGRVGRIYFITGGVPSDVAFIKESGRNEEIEELTVLWALTRRHK